MKNIRQTVVVTGGAGFIGSHVADAYIAAGHQLWILDDLSTGKRENIPPTAQFIQADLAEASTSDVLGLLLAEEKIDAVNGWELEQFMGAMSGRDFIGTRVTVD